MIFFLDEYKFLSRYFPYNAWQPDLKLFIFRDCLVQNCSGQKKEQNEEQEQEQKEEQDQDQDVDTSLDVEMEGEKEMEKGRENVTLNEKFK